MIVNVEVRKNQNEQGLSLIRRFQKRVQESGILPRVRSIRYSERPLSPLKRKRSALKMIARRAHFEHLRKIGKLPARKRGRGRR